MGFGTEGKRTRMCQKKKDGICSNRGGEKAEEEGGMRRKERD